MEVPEANGDVPFSVTPEGRGGDVNPLGDVRITQRGD